MKGQTLHLQFFTNVTILSTLPYFEKICGEDRYHAYISTTNNCTATTQHVTTNNGIWFGNLTAQQKPGTFCILKKLSYNQKS